MRESRSVASFLSRASWISRTIVRFRECFARCARLAISRSASCALSSATAWGAPSSSWNLATLALNRSSLASGDGSYVNASFGTATPTSRSSSMPAILAISGSSSSSGSNAAAAGLPPAAGAKGSTATTSSAGAGGAGAGVSGGVGAGVGAGGDVGAGAGASVAAGGGVVGAAGGVVAGGGAGVGTASSSGGAGAIVVTATAGAGASVAGCGGTVGMREGRGASSAGVGRSAPATSVTLPPPCRPTNAIAAAPSKAIAVRGFILWVQDRRSIPCRTQAAPAETWGVQRSGYEESKS